MTVIMIIGGETVKIIPTRMLHSCRIKVESLNQFFHCRLQPYVIHLIQPISFVVVVVVTELMLPFYKDQVWYFGNGKNIQEFLVFGNDRKFEKGRKCCRRR